MYIWDLIAALKQERDALNEAISALQRLTRMDTAATVQLARAYARLDSHSVRHHERARQRPERPHTSRVG